MICPRCGRENSKRRLTCKNCRAPLSNDPRALAWTPPVQQRVTFSERLTSGVRMAGIWIGVFLAALVVVFAAIGVASFWSIVRPIVQPTITPTAIAAATPTVAPAVVVVAAVPPTQPAAPTNTTAPAPPTATQIQPTPALPTPTSAPAVAAAVAPPTTAPATATAPPEPTSRPAPPTATPEPQHSPEELLAIIQYGGSIRPDDPRIKPFADQLDRLEAKCVQDRMKLADLTTGANKVMADRGVKEPILETARGVAIASEGLPAEGDCQALFVGYATLRLGGAPGTGGR